MKYILILNGPNLNLLGQREPDIYGTATLGDIIASLGEAFPQTALRHVQSNHEGAVIDAIQQHGLDPDCLGIVLNAGAFTHYSYAIRQKIAFPKAGRRFCYIGDGECITSCHPCRPCRVRALRARGSPLSSRR